MGVRREGGRTAHARDRERYEREKREERNFEKIGQKLTACGYARTRLVTHCRGWNSSFQ